MEKVVLDLPALWADHHVQAVREVLAGLDGVEDVYASSGWKQALVSYDPGKIKPATIEEALAEAGYPVGEGAPPILARPGLRFKDPAWNVLGMRVTETNRTDLEMSGEFRRY